MIFRWFVSFVYRTYEDGPIKFGSSVCSTDVEAFPFVQMAESIADKDNYFEVVILNWKSLNEYEFMAASGKPSHPIRDVT